jgi:hypothetical protein
MDSERRSHGLTRRTLLGVLFAAIVAAVVPPVSASTLGDVTFRGVRTQFIAALADPDASSGANAQSWGLWEIDPGPRGVWLKNFDSLRESGGVAPAQWQFDQSDWWLDENGLIMEQPVYSIPPGKYVVTGARETVAVLTIHPMDADGNMRWELGDEATIYDVTHLRCRSARYTSAGVSGACSPANAQAASFPVAPGGLMPPIGGCNKMDYTVLFIVAVAVDN